MLVTDGVLVGLVVGFLRRGRLSGLAGVSWRWAWLPVAALPLQLFVIVDPFGVLADPGLSGQLIEISYAALVVFVAANIRVPGFPLLAFGLAANLLVMLSNGGLMPASPQTVAAAGLTPPAGLTVGGRTPLGKDIILPSEQTRLAFLSDVIVTPPVVTLTNWVPRPRVASPGDVFLFVGLIYAVAKLMRPRHAAPADDGHPPTASLRSLHPGAREKVEPTHPR